MKTLCPPKDKSKKKQADTEDFLKFITYFVFEVCSVSIIGNGR